MNLGGGAMTGFQCSLDPTMMRGGSVFTGKMDPALHPVRGRCRKTG